MNYSAVRRATSGGGTGGGWGDPSPPPSPKAPPPPPTPEHPPRAGRRRTRPARFWAAVGAFNELIAGPLLALGLLTPIAASLLIAQCAYIIAKVHWPKGFWNRDGGIEFALQLLAASLLLAASGPGAISLDALLGLAFSSELRLAIFLVATAGMLVALALPRFLGATPDQSRAA